MSKLTEYVLQDHRLRYNNLDIKHIIGHYFVTPSFRLIILFRLSQYLKKSKVLGGLLNVYLIRQCNKHLITLSPEMTIGPGLIFPHEGPVTINLNSIIGSNCTIHPNVLIGGNKPKGAPHIGDNCFIGNGAKIIGRVNIGNYCFLAPGAIVTKDMPDNTLVGSGYNNVLLIGGGKSMLIYIINRIIVNKNPYIRNGLFELCA